MSLIPAGALAVMLFAAVPTAVITPGIYTGAGSQPTSLEHVLHNVRAGELVIVSEQHDLRLHHENQLAVLQTLRHLKLNVSVGLEFLAYPDQVLLDRYTQGETPESDFLQAAHWDGAPFEWYRPLILFPRQSGGQSRALNAPRQLTTALAQRGPIGLSPEERSWLPPKFRLGNAQYFERFAREVHQHGTLTDRQVRRFFAAQSAWDDTMAWQASEYLAARPDQVLVIIVGDFHAAYGGGLPDRLKARGVRNILVISQVNAYGMSDEEVHKLLAPDPRYGARGDFVWLTWDQPRR